MTDRHCARGNHWRPVAAFKRFPSGRIARDCETCIRDQKLRTEQRRIAASMHRGTHVPKSGQYLEATKEFPGLDMDAIYRNPRWNPRLRT